MRYLFAALACVMVATFASSGTASAHARYKDSTPARGEVVAASPPTVSITFTQEIQKITGTYSISVTDAAGTEFTSGAAILDDDDRTMLSAPLQPSLPPGRYVVAFTNVSDADGDAYEGAFSFYVQVQPTEEDLAADSELAADDEQTPAASVTASGDPPATPGGNPTPSPTDTPDVEDDDGSDNNALLWVGIAVVAGVAVGAVGFMLVRASRGT